MQGSRKTKHFNEAHNIPLKVKLKLKIKLNNNFNGNFACTATDC